MFKYLAIAIFAAFLSACGAAEEPVDLTGSWQTVAEDDDSILMNASVSNGEIEISWVVDASTRGLYWKGTTPDSVTSGDIFVSDGNTEEMDASLFGSGDETKEFTYASDQISFDFTVMGITRTLYLERV